MSTVRDLIERVKGLPGCSLNAEPSGMTVADWERANGLTLPADLKEFLELCSGAVLFEDRPYPLHIHGLPEIKRANPVIVGDPCQEDRSYNWFVIANDGEGEYLSIDLAPERLGRCYDSFFDVHGVPGSCAIVATSFADLLKRAMANGGRHWWWLEPSFERLGDAYDD